MDLYIEWLLDSAQGYTGPVQRVVIELKLLHGGWESTLQAGIEQTQAYAKQFGADEAHLVIFDQKKPRLGQACLAATRRRVDSVGLLSGSRQSSPNAGED